MPDGQPRRRRHARPREGPGRHHRAAERRRPARLDRRRHRDQGRRAGGAAVPEHALDLQHRRRGHRRGARERRKPGRGGRGRFPQVAGLKFTWDPNAPPMQGRIKEVLVRDGDAWVPIAPAKVYSVVTNNFMRNGGDGYVRCATRPPTPTTSAPGSRTCSPTTSQRTRATSPSPMAASARSSDRTRTSLHGQIRLPRLSARQGPPMPVSPPVSDVVPSRLVRQDGMKTGTSLCAGALRRTRSIACVSARKGGRGRGGGTGQVTVPRLSGRHTPCAVAGAGAAPVASSAAAIRSVLGHHLLRRVLAPDMVLRAAASKATDAARQGGLSPPSCSIVGCGRKDVQARTSLKR